MKIILEAKALTVNKAWKGRRYKTQDYKDYEHEITMLLASQKAVRRSFSGQLGVSIIFYLRRASTTDLDNLLKPLFDILTANEIIPDDRFIYDLKVKKEKSDKDKIEIIIKKL